jgi:hypothetical protein
MRVNQAASERLDANISKAKQKCKAPGTSVTPVEISGMVVGTRR